MKDPPGQRLDNFLVKTAQRRAHARYVYRVIRSGEVRVNKGTRAVPTRGWNWATRSACHRCVYRCNRHRTHRRHAPAREFPVVFEDEFLLAIDKPAGVAVHGGSGESFGVIEQLRRARPAAEFLELVHRLDKETSGLLLVAKKRPALVALQNDLRSRNPERAFGKTYSALVAGHWPESLKVIDVALHKFTDADGGRRVQPVDAADERGRRSITLVRVAERFADSTLLDVTIKTGRTHQIRVHLTHSGHAIVGDPKYGDFALNKAVARGTAVPGTRFERMFLHARRLRFVNPATGLPLELEAPLPDACALFLEALR